MVGRLLDLGARYALLLVVFASPARAAITSTGNVTPAVTSWRANRSGIVGDTSDGSIRVDGASALLNATATLGNAAGVAGTVVASGTGTRWRTSDDQYIGRNGAGVAVVEAGALMTSRDSHLGYAEGSTGAVVVTGAGSTWTASRAVYIGGEGAGSFVLNAGGVATSVTATLGREEGSSGMATVSGVGSRWTASTNLFVGSGGEGSLTVADGGHVQTGTLHASLDDLAGNGTISATNGAVLDAALISTSATSLQQSIAFGTGGALSVDFAGKTLGVGYRTQGSLLVSNGVTLDSSQAFLGYAPGSSGSASISGVGSRWKSTALYVGRLGQGTLAVNNGGAVETGTLYASLDDLVGNGLISATTGAILDANLAFNATHPGPQTLAFGSGGQLTLQTPSGDFGVGYHSQGNLSVTEGAKLASTYGYLGYDADATGHAIISGTGSEWAMSQVLYVGRAGTGSILIDHGAQLKAAATFLGNDVGSAGSLTIRNQGSLTGGWASVGVRDSGSLLVESAGKVQITDLYLGQAAGATGTAQVIGAGSILTASADIHVGYLGHGDLRITGGGVVNADRLFQASEPGSSGAISVSGADSKLNVTGSFDVGRDGNGSLTVSAGATVNSGGGSLGSFGDGSAIATITGPGSRWNVSEGIQTRDGSPSLHVADGAEVAAESLYASQSNLTGNGTITVANGGFLDGAFTFDAAHPTQAISTFGTGGTLKLSVVDGLLWIGYRESGVLNILDGATITSHTGQLAYEASSTASAVVAGAGSKWTATNGLFVGGYGKAALTIADGGQVTSAYGTVANNAGSVGAVTVKGANSRWTNADDLEIGYYGDGALTIENGGQVTSKEGNLGNYYNSGSHGVATITGSGSRWTMSSMLEIQVGSSLTIASAGRVDASMATIHDHITVTGAGSILSTVNNIYVGFGGSTGTLDITSGGLAAVGWQLWTSGAGSTVNLATGGTLALLGNSAGSLQDFLTAVQGTDAIRYWNAGLASWTPLTSTAVGVDYTLAYQSTGALAGYTLLTVGRIGDADSNGLVDGNDYLALQRTPVLGSINDWKSRYGNQASTLSAAQIVPEPATLHLVAAAATAMGLFRRRRPKPAAL